MPRDALLNLSIQDQVALIKSRKITATELMQATLAYIDISNSSLDAVIHLDKERALNTAQAIDQILDNNETDPGPLAGIPILMKDMMEICDQPGFCGSYAFDPAPANQDATVVAKLREAGAIILGKTATYEFALNGPDKEQPYPPAKNPWNHNHIPGGSSSGSAAAVAARMVRASIGTDTGGSVRSPASYCGITGLKPTRATISNDGVFPLSKTLDTIGILSPTVAEAALIFDILSGQNTQKNLQKPIKNTKIGYARNWFINDPAIDPQTIQALDDAASQLSLLGATISIIDLPSYAPIEAAGSTILTAEAYDTHRLRLVDHAEHYGNATYRNLMSGAKIDTETLEKAHIVASKFNYEIDTILTDYDALITATTLEPAPAFTDFEDGAKWTAMRTIPFNMTGHPAFSLPCGFSSGLPVGLQIVARHNEEAKLLQIGDAFEQSTNFSLQQPPSGKK